MTPPLLSHFCDLEVQVGEVLDLGEGQAGRRRIVPILGGLVRGRITGRVLGLGADWQTIFADGAAGIDSRYAVETDDGAVIEVVDRGVRFVPTATAAAAGGAAPDPASVYFRTAARLRTGHPDYEFLNRMIFVGSGRKQDDAVRISLFAVE